MQRSVLICIWSLLGLAAAPHGVEALVSASQPNVLLIMVDDLSTDLGSYGNREVSTPHIDRLAKIGMRFDRAYSQFPTCNPSRTSMLTGLRPDTTGILDNTVNFRTVLPDVVTLPQLFRESGYLTMNIGKTFHGVGDKSWDDAAAWDISITPSGRRNWRRGEGRNMTGGKIAWARWVASIRGDNDQPDGRIALAAVEALEELGKSEAPFFLAVGFHRPHSPFIAPEPYFDVYDLDRLRLRTPPPDHPGDLAGTKTRRHARIFRKMGEQDRREFLRAYYACVSFIDQQVGLLLETLDRLDGWRDTIVVLTSDHGVHLGEHDWWDKDTLFEPSIQVPLVIYVPGLDLRRHRSRRLVELLDLYPTLVELAGLTPPEGLEGRSLVPLLERPGRRWSPAAFSQVERKRFRGFSLRTERWRFTRWEGSREGIELYDHARDPDEYRNVANEPEYRQLVDELDRELESVFQR